MKTQIKKTIALFLTIVLMLTVLPFSEFRLIAGAVSGNEIVEYAKTFLGKPYVYGASGPDSFDCSGLTMYVFNHFGISLPHSTYTLWDYSANYGQVIQTGSTSKAVAGDLILWQSHVAIYTSNGGCIEALNYSYGVTDKVKVDSHTNGTNYKVLRINGVSQNPPAPTVRYSNNNGKVTFSWDSYSGSFDYYYLRVYKDKIWSSTVKTRDTGKSTSTTINLGNGHYVAYLDVYRANEAIAASGYSNPTEFDVSLNTTRTSRNNNIGFYSWPAHPGAQSYNLRVKKVVGDQWIEQDCSVWGINEPSGHIEVPENGTYVVYAEAETSDGYCAYSIDTVEFTKEDPFLTATVSGGTVNFNWTAYSSTHHYCLRIYKNRIWEEHVVSHDNLTSLSYTETLPSGTYAAFVECMNSSGNSYHYGTAIKFTVNHIHSYSETSRILPTCTENGSITYSCACGDTYSDSIPAAGHDFIDTVMQSTCTEEGSITHSCRICGNVYTETIPALGHNYQRTVTAPTCSEKGFTTYNCSRCGDTYVSDYTDMTPHQSATWYTVKNPTASSDGLAEKRCDRCNTVIEQFTIPHLVPDYATGITISSDKETLNIGDTVKLSAEVKPDTANNKNVIWTSADPKVATVNNGTVKAIKPGATVIIAQTEDGGYKDVCLVNVISIKGINGAIVESENGFIYGLSARLNNVNGLIQLVDENMSISINTPVIGTGSMINIIDNGEIIDSYEAIIFGDVNGDGGYDGMDAVIVSCLANGMLSKEDVSEAAYIAADCNHDGIINNYDSDLLQRAGTNKAEIEQGVSNLVTYSEEKPEIILENEMMGLLCDKCNTAIPDMDTVNTFMALQEDGNVFTEFYSEPQERKKKTEDVVFCDDAAKFRYDN